jgi:transposase, IS5 family
MKQISLATTGFELVTKRTRKRVFLDEMNLVVPWTELVGLIQPFASGGTGPKGGRPSFPMETMLRIHVLQQWFGLSDRAMEEALHDVSLYCEFARLDPGAMRLPDESTILRFRHLLEENNLSIQLLATINATLATKGLMLKTGTVIDATLIAAPSSTKNSTGERDPEMHQTKKGNQWHFGMKAHIGVDADSGLVHTVIGTAANVNGVTQGHGLLHGEEQVIFADAGYQGALQRLDQEHGATGDAVCAEQFVDGSQKTYGGSGMSAPAMLASARPRPQRASNQSQNAPKFGDNALRFSSGVFLIFNSRESGVVQTFLKAACNNSRYAQT